MRAGFAKTDITPRIGVGLCGFGPFLQRRSIGVRDRLWAKAAAFEQSGKKYVLVSCDLVGLTMETVQRVRDLVHAATRLPHASVMTECTHTHSGPCTGACFGWGEEDPPYLELLPGRIADACIRALGKLQEVTMSHAEVPCEGIGLNREYDKDAPPLEEVLDENWRPAKPELTDTTCHVFTFKDTGGGMIGFMSYFGCHPVVCCQETRYFHGDFVGVATNMLERENLGSIGLFVQGAEGDVNSCVVHKPEKEALLALDVIAARYARAVRRGLCEAKPVEVDSISCASSMAVFSRKHLSVEKLRAALAKEEAILYAPGASDESYDVRMSTVAASAIRHFISMVESGETSEKPVELQGLRLGPISLLGAPFEIFQAIKNDVAASAVSQVTLVTGLVNGTLGYAMDRTTAEKSGYTAEVQPLIVAQMLFKDVHTELVRELLELEKQLVS